MKKLAFAALAAFLGATGFGAPAVTPRQMTNCVETACEAVTSNLTAKIDAVETNVVAQMAALTTNVETRVSAAETNVAATVAALQTNVANAVSTLQTNVNAQVGAATSNLTATVAEAVTNLTASVIQSESNLNERVNLVNAGLTNLYEYVQTNGTGGGGVPSAAITNVLKETVKQLNNDVELKYDTQTGVAYFTVAEVDGLNITNRTYRFTKGYETTYGTRYGAVVISSDDPNMPVGTFLGKYGNAYTVASVSGSNLGRVTLDYHYGWFETEGHPQQYRVWNFTGTNTTTVSGIQHRRVFSSLATADKAVEVTSLHYVNGSVISNTFVITGYLLTDETLKSVTGYQTISQNADTWAAMSGYREARVQTYLQPITTTAFFHPRRTFSLMDLLIPPVYAALPSGASYVSGLESCILSFPKNCGMVSSWNYAMNGETPETHKAHPESVYDKEAWENPDNWIEPPTSFGKKGIDVTISYVNEYGETVTQVVKIKDADTAMGLLSGAAGVRSPWSGPSFSRKGEKCEKGHIYVKCKCKYCPAQRAHTWETVNPSQCDRCTNKDTKEKWDSELDIYVPDGELSSVCDHKCTSDGDSHHRGWTASGQSEDISCCCECGHYNSVRTHAHSYTPPSTTVWSETKRDGTSDGVNHWSWYQCNRTCGQYKEVSQAHEDSMEEDEGAEEAGKTTPIDNYKHWVDAHCTANGCTYQGQIEKPHKFYPQATGENKCYCYTCEGYFHLWPDTGSTCGDYTTYTCSRCGCTATKDGSTYEIIPASYLDDYHTFGKPLEEGDEDYDEKHQCMCGKMEEDHENPLSLKDGYLYYCSICGYIRGKKKSSGKPKCPFHVTGGSGSVSGKDARGFKHESSSAWGTSLTGTCPDCGGKFSGDFPDANFNMAAANDWYSKSPFMTWIVSYPNLTAALSAAEGWRSTFAQGMQVGGTCRCEIHYNMHYVTNYNSFLERVVSNLTYKTATYSGTCAEDEQHNKYIAW